MQQLSPSVLTQALTVRGDVILIDLPLPASIAATNQWLNRFCTLTGAAVTGQEWGADRFQAHLRLSDKALMLCIEWLCDAMWLEPDAGEARSAAELAAYLVDNVSSQNR